MAITEITALIVALMPIIVQVVRLIDARIESEKYHDFRDGMKDIALAVEEDAKEHPEFYKTSAAKLAHAVMQASDRWPKMPTNTVKTTLKSVLTELGLGKAAKEKGK